MKPIVPALLLTLTLSSLSLADASVTWQQVGGSLGSTATLKGIVGQGYETPAPAGSGPQVQSGFLAHPLLVNNAPFVVSGLPDLEQIEGFGKVRIRLDTTFSDIDGDQLTFSLLDSGVGTSASIHGDSLVLSGQAGIWGAARIIVLATDGSDTAKDTFRVTTSRPSALGARPATGKKSTLLGVSAPKILAAPAIGSGTGRLGDPSRTETFDGLSVNILLPAVAHVSVSIYDNLGTSVISFSQSIEASDLQRLERTADGRQILTVAWNLRSANGVAVPAGVYLWKIDVTTQDGQKLQTYKRLGVKETK
ncbi:MAG: hypothetical protein IPK50_14285 [Fibrobacterota bacterium]|nr:MAG: hypothetical protein IPK50_14285 [Fibrobacterota bacterium]